MYLAEDLLFLSDNPCCSTKLWLNMTAEILSTSQFTLAVMHNWNILLRTRVLEDPRLSSRVEGGTININPGLI